MTKEREKSMQRWRAEMVGFVTLWLFLHFISLSFFPVSFFSLHFCFFLSLLFHFSAFFFLYFCPFSFFFRLPFSFFWPDKSVGSDQESVVRMSLFVTLECTSVTGKGGAKNRFWVSCQNHGQNHVRVHVSFVFDIQPVVVQRSCRDLAVPCLGHRVQARCCRATRLTCHSAPHARVAQAQEG